MAQTYTRLRLSSTALDYVRTRARLYVKELADHADPTGKRLRIIFPYLKEDRKTIEPFLRDYIFEPIVITGMEADLGRDIEVARLAKRVIRLVWLFEPFPKGSVCWNLALKADRLGESEAGSRRRGGLPVQEKFGWIRGRSTVQEGLVRLAGDDIQDSVGELFKLALFRNARCLQQLATEDYLLASGELLDHFENRVMTAGSHDEEMAVALKAFRRASDPELLGLLAVEAVHRYCDTLCQTVRAAYRGLKQGVRPPFSRWEKRLFHFLYLRQSALAPLPLGFMQEVVWSFIGVDRSMDLERIVFQDIVLKRPGEDSVRLMQKWRAYLCIYRIYCELEFESLRHLWRDKKRQRGAKFELLDENAFGSMDENLNEIILREAVDKCLPPDCREVWKLYHDEGLDEAEIAQRQGISQSTVSRKLEKAKSRLRKRFAKKLSG